jgi:hypothetical protein
MNCWEPFRFKAAAAHSVGSLSFSIINLGLRRAPPQGGVPSRAARLGCETLCCHPRSGLGSKSEGGEFRP